MKLQSFTAAAVCLAGVYSDVDVHRRVSTTPRYEPLPNVTKYCSYWFDYDLSTFGCEYLAEIYNITMEQFYRWNPDSKDCVITGLNDGESYCVEVANEPGFTTTATSTSTSRAPRRTYTPKPWPPPETDITEFPMETATSTAISSTGMSSGPVTSTPGGNAIAINEIAKPTTTSNDTKTLFPNILFLLLGLLLVAAL